MKEILSRRSFFKWSLLSLPILKIGSSFASAVTCPLPAPKDSKIAAKVIKASNRAIKRLKFVFNLLGIIPRSLLRLSLVCKIADEQIYTQIPQCLTTSLSLSMSN